MAGLRPVFRGGRTLLLFKDTAEIQRIVISDDPADLRHVIVGCLEQDLRVGDAYGDNVLHWRSVGILPEAADKPAHAHAPRCGIRLDVDLCVVVVVEILYRSLHLCVQIDVPAPAVGGQLAVDGDEELPQ